MSDFVLDASAVLAFLKREPGADVVAALLARSLIGTVNLSEVAARLDEEGAPAERLMRAFVAASGVAVVAFDEDLSYRTGALRGATKPYGLSLGDHACLALAGRETVPAVTAERVWASLSIGVSVRLIRP